ncbi:transmembrane protein 260 isoform X3 [Oreochromis niloticus]|uniref:transmembrane protein 260 isoform X3 n=1 Tax=Oreochromis niloticus TaxID=8128 RepID=UPI000674700A|nr:transmembrane protein 260 isoform X3 [Oreochromis niloticus]
MSAEHRASWILTGTVVACVAALYVPCVQRTVPGGDSGELITTACELGVAHPPGYPLFTLLAHMAMRLLPSLSPAHSVNLMSSLLGAAACGGFCITVCRLAGPGPGAVLAGGLFAVSRLSWQWSMVAEVFTLNNLFIGLLFFLTASFHCAENATQRKKTAHWGALCCGLGLCNQHTLVLYVLVIIPWVLYRLYSQKELSLRGLVSLGFCFLAGFLPYIYLPISSYLNTARWSWGDQTTLSGLLTHLLRAEYGTFCLAKTETSVNLTTMLQAQLDHSLAELSLPVLVLAGMGFALSSLDRRCRSVSWLLTVMLVVYSLFFAWRANLDISRPLLLGVVERFWLQSDAAVCVLAGLGLSRTLAGLERRLGYGGLWKTTGWVFTAALLAHMVHTNHRRDVFACIGLPDGDLSWERSYSRWPLGVCDYLVPIQKQFHPEEWAHRTRNIYNWSDPHNSFHPASWERVANEEMWQARMKTAFFLFDLAERMQGEGKARLFELSYTLYKEIVEAHSDYPPNWDKNLALACERLLRSGHRGYSADSLLTCSVQHFSLYLEKDPTDPQAPAIRSAITHLLQERDRFRQSRRQTP